MKKYFILAVSLFLFNCSSKIDEVIDEIDEFKVFLKEEGDDISNDISNWLKNLPDDLRPLVEDDLKDALSESAGLTKIQAFCGAKNTLEMALRELDKAKFRLLVKVVKSSPPIIENDFCHPSQNEINLKNDLESSFSWYGYNWNKDKVMLRWVDNNNQANDIPNLIHKVSKFVITIPISELSKPKYKNIKSLHLFDKNKGEVVSEIPVISPQKEPCWKYIYSKKLCGDEGFNKFRLTPPKDVKRIAFIKVWSGKHVDAIQLTWELNNGNYVDSDKVGGNGGSRNVLTLTENEFIQRFYFSHGKILDQMWIYTNKNNKGLHFGGKGGDRYCEYTIPSGLDFIGVYGSYGTFEGNEVIANLGFISRELELNSDCSKN